MALNVSLNASEVLLNATTSLQQVSSITSFNDYFAQIKPLSLFVLGIVVYAFFVFKFYRFLAKRQIIKMDWHQRLKGFGGFLETIFKIVFWFVENVVIMPLLVFFWFSVLAILILMVTKTHTPDTVLLIAMAIVAAVRVTAYYTEELSRDLAKMIPFALLGIFIVDMTAVSVSSLSVAKELVQFLDKAVYYLVFVVIVEFVMSVVYAATKHLRKEPPMKVTKV